MVSDYEERLREQEGIGVEEVAPEPLEPGEGPQKPKKSHLKQLVIFFGVLAVILVIVSIVVSSGAFSSKKISEKKLIVGAALTMEENKSLEIQINEESHEVEIEKIGEDWVEIVIRSDPIRFTLEVNQVLEIDLDGDGQSDLRIKLFKIQNGKAVIAIKRIDKEACIEDWTCDSWKDCVGDKRERICTDRNECKSEFYKPIMEQKCVGNAPVERDDLTSVGVDNGAEADTLSGVNNTGGLDNTVSLNNTDASGGPAQYGECGDGVCGSGENTSSYPYYCPEDCNANVDVNDSDIHYPCSEIRYPCYEPQGYFCSSWEEETRYNPFCCSSECIKFESIEQFCDA